MLTISKASWKAFYWRTRCDLYKFTRQMHNTFLDMIIPAAMGTIIWGYIMPVLGVPADFGGFVMLGWLVLYCSAMPYWEFGFRALMDLLGDRTLEYDLTLMMPAWLVFLRIAVSWFLKASLHNAFTILIVKLILGSRFDISSLIVSRYLLMYLLMNVCFSTFAALMVFCWKTTDQFQRFWGRVVIQLIFLGGLQFPFIIVAKNLPWASYLMLLNPFTYAYEGIRASVFGQQGYLNFWLCIAMIVAFTGVFMYLGMRFFKKRLDCVWG